MDIFFPNFVLVHRNDWQIVFYEVLIFPSRSYTIYRINGSVIYPGTVGYIEVISWKAEAPSRESAVTLGYVYYPYKEFLVSPGS